MIWRHIAWILMITTVSLIGIRRAHGAILFVNANLSTGANSGNDWADAFQGPTGLMAALAVAQSGDDIWVAQGTYIPTDNGDTQLSFSIDVGRLTV